MNSAHSIQEPRDHRLFVSFPRLFADFHALHRLLTPRHPPCALNRLAAEISNSRHHHSHLAATPAVLKHKTSANLLANDITQQRILKLSSNLQPLAPTPSTEAGPSAAGRSTKNFTPPKQPPATALHPRVKPKGQAHHRQPPWALCSFKMPSTKQPNCQISIRRAELA